MIFIAFSTNYITNAIYHEKLDFTVVWYNVFMSSGKIAQQGAFCARKLRECEGYFSD